MKEIVIIGAGPAGLSAALELLKTGDDYKVTILEESNAIGGISRTVVHNGNRMDIGGHRFFSKDERVMRWWDDMLSLQGSPSFDDNILGREKKLSENGPDPEKTDEVMLLRQRVSRIYYNRHFFDYPVSMKWDTIKNMGFATTVNAGFSYMASAVHKKPEDSLENFYINRFGKKLYSMFFESYTEKLWGRHPREISADWGAQRVKGLSITAIIKDIVGKIFPKKNKKVETSLIEEFIYPKLGPGQLWECTAKKIEEMGGTIKMNSRVVGIHSENGGISAVSYIDESGEEKTISGDIFISSMPVRDLIAGMRFDVPENVRYVADGLPYRDFVTVGILVNKLNLVNKTKIKTLNNIVPDCWIYIQEKDVKLGRIQIFNNWSPYMVNDPENTVWVGLEYFCAEGDEFWNMSDSDRLSFVEKELCKMGIIEKDSILDFHCEKVKKAYPAYFDTYDRLSEVTEYLDSFKNLYCVGRNGQHRYNNMDHSMVTSFEAVNCIVNNIESKDSVWKVNTEEEYHESK